MRHLAIALGLCFVTGLLSSPLDAAVSNSSRSAVLLNVKKHKAKKVKPHNAPKHQARKATTHGN